jgi:nitronate monooxygenase
MDIPPVVLAPLAGGPSTPELAAAVANAGGLGFLGAGYLPPETVAAQIRRTRERTRGLLGVNVFVLAEMPVDEQAVARYTLELEPEARAHGVELGLPRFDDDRLAGKLDVVVSERVDVLSTTFGFLPAPLVERVQRSGTSVWATVTSVAEARAAAAAGADALVVQGAEAGGHRGSWTDDGEALPLVRLLAAVRAAVDLPLVAAGGIADAAGAVTARSAGAVAVQAGTAFLLADEAGTSPPHRRAFAAGGETAFTRAFTGRTARGLVNGFMRRHPSAPSAYPHVHHVTAPLRAAARAAGDADRINLWAGTSFAQAEAAPAAEIVAALTSV